MRKHVANLPEPAGGCWGGGGGETASTILTQGSRALTGRGSVWEIVTAQIDRQVERVRLIDDCGGWGMSRV